MKTPLNEEFIRMQRLAGLITENEYKQKINEEYTLKLKSINPGRGAQKFDKTFIINSKPTTLFGGNWDAEEVLDIVKDPNLLSGDVAIELIDSNGKIIKKGATSGWYGDIPSIRNIEEEINKKSQTNPVAKKDAEQGLKETFLFEEIADEEIEKAAAAALNISPDQVINHEPSEEEKKVNEIGVTLAITIAGLIPPALNLVGSTANKAKQMFSLNNEEKVELEKLNKLIKGKEKYVNDLDKKNDPKEEKERELLNQLIKQRDTQFGTKLGNMAKYAAHSLHEAYVYPIKKMLQFVAWTSKKFGKKTKLSDEKYREKIANIIYATAMVGIAGYAIFSHIGHLAGIAPVATFIADGVKAGKSIADIVNGAALLI